MPPALVTSVILGSLYGLIFFLLSGAARRSLWIYWIVGAGAFIVGQMFAELVNRARPLTGVTFGDVYVIEASVICWIALFLFHNRSR